MAESKLRYVNISWCKLTHKSTPLLAKFIQNNKCLEKLLMQHNDIADPEKDTGSLNTAMAQIIEAIRGHPGLKYLDISATELKSKNFKNLLYH